MKWTPREKRIVRYDPMLPTAAIFGSLSKGPRPKLDARCEFGGVEWRLRGPDMLGMPEQTLLLVLLELATEQYSAGHAGLSDWNALVGALANGADSPDAMPPVPTREGEPVALATLAVSYSELIRRCGRQAEGGNAARQIRLELERLCEVTVWATSPSGVQVCSRLLQWRRGDSNGVQVVLNWRLTEILVGRQFSPVSLTERLALRSDAARALHCALSVRIRLGNTMSFRLDTLASYVWPDGRPVAASTLRRRRQLLRVALSDISQLPGWTLKASAGSCLAQAESVTVTRQRFQDEARASIPKRSPRCHKQPPNSKLEAAEQSVPKTPTDVSGWFT
ncbi:replication protein C, IncQ-type [Cupriavidus lacunae]|uniref:Replication protein C n=1 Tax=Cupriavidus lacunae TaxID=2666307 RepID=A0A370NU76_9BURK|nr:replication protein C, IncQ-type [Cupriavidus lacunae]RDK09160.1 hypothetical protein DN412_17120 [Cupriavidus lacunae]